MFRICVFLILALRIAIFFIFPSFHIDMDTWKAWATRLAEVGPSNFYSPTYFSDYFPGYLYILWFIATLFKLLAAFVNSFNFEIVIKLITTAFDLGSALIIYELIRKTNKTIGKVSFLLYLSNPAIIFNSSIWGQVDGFFTFFLLLSSYYLLEKKNVYKSSVAVGLAILTKPQALSFLPVWLFNNFQFTFKKFFKGGIVLILTVIIFSLPFFFKLPPKELIKFLLNSINLYPYTSLYAFNFWAIFGWWKPDNLSFIFSYKTWGTFLYMISLVLIAVPLFKKKIDSRTFFFSQSLSLLSFFLFWTRMHERYIFPFFAFLLVAAALKKSKELFGVYIIASIIHLINLWFVYYYYDFVYNNHKVLNDASYSLYGFINNSYKLFSILNFIIFIYILYFYYKSYAKKS